jgi:hypothetical protein
LIINMESFGLREGSDNDNVLAVYAALKESRNTENPILLFPKGIYHFRPERASENLYYITNHDQGGTRRTDFPIIGIDHLTIDGQGS